MEEEYAGYDRYLVERLKRYVLRKYGDASFPEVRWDDIADHELAKKLIGHACSPRHYPDVLKGICRPWYKSVLLVGPFGNGKKMLAEAAANEFQYTFFETPSYIFAFEDTPESEKTVRLLFQMAKKFAPSIIFINELDFLCSPEETGSDMEICRRAKCELINQINGISPTDDPTKRVVVIASSYRPWNIDEDLWKCMEKRIYIPPPDATGRADFFKLSLKDWLSKDADLKEIANSFCDHSREDIAKVCRNAKRSVCWRIESDLRANGLTDEEIGTFCMNNSHPTVTAEDFQEADRISCCPSKSCKKDLKKYEELRAGSGRGQDIIF